MCLIHKFEELSPGWEIDIEEVGERRRSEPSLEILALACRKVTNIPRSIPDIICNGVLLPACWPITFYV